MNFLIFCLYSFLLIISPLKAADLLDADEIKKEFKAFKTEICKKNTSDLPSVLKEKYEAIVQTIDNKMAHIKNYKAKKRTSSGYIEALLESRLGGEVDYINNLIKAAAINKSPPLEIMAKKPALFISFDLVNYLLGAKLIKYFYQQTLLENLTEKTKIYLNASKTLWGYLQNENTLHFPTTGDLYEEASLFTQYVKHQITPPDVFPPLKTQ